MWQICVMQLSCLILEVVEFCLDLLLVIVAFGCIWCQCVAGVRKRQAARTACDCESSLFHEGGRSEQNRMILKHMPCKSMAGLAVMRLRKRSRQLVVFVCFVHRVRDMTRVQFGWSATRARKGCLRAQDLSDFNGGVAICRCCGPETKAATHLSRHSVWLLL